MDPELAALAATAATTLVASLATDGWERAKSAMGSLWRRVHPDRADAVEADLVDIRAEVLAAREAGDERTEQVLAEEWRSRLRRLLASDPQLANELRQIVAELTPKLPEMDQARIGQISMTATASDHSHIIQLGQGTQSIVDR
ncbi:MULTISPECIES: hypothetical protein [unclassified Pseudofrankia]|uniref:hypothetical protein n=1 Tax=unclassified Pseudofrankia TaxID=2994372 RepID=UPI0008D950B1|nr:MULTISPECIES: hypothetical protein [unclassified Pseudofrankia]MDT3438823.1 hypothetical protein [Pseudofrankia sp. BMG5.37]OHV75202.1 hypothetical protein BCD48_00220 [Pseudofrankia sp. BMG5.36]